MIEVWCLLLICTILAYRYSKGIIIDESGTAYQSANIGFVFFLLATILVMYAGLRTRMNDTGNYIMAYLNDYRTPSGFISLFRVNWNIGENPLFNVYFRVVKTICGPNSQILVFISSFIIECSYLTFLRKYSKNFGLTIFVFLSFTVYAFSLAAMKQCMAISIGIWAVPAFLEKKYCKALFLIITAILFHPFIILLASLVFLRTNTWKKQTISVVVITIFIALGYNVFLNRLLWVTEAIGEEYTVELFTEKGVGYFRVIVYLLLPLLSYLCRDDINDMNDPMINICVNGSIVSGCLMVIASLGGANFVGRTGNYFDVFTCVAAPVVLSCIDRKLKFLKYLYIMAMLLFYYTYYHKYLVGYCGGNWFECIYRHASILTLFGLGG